MKIGWLVWQDSATKRPELWTVEPDSWQGYRIVQIVYAEVEGN